MTMKIATFDIETNSIDVQQVTQVWCACVLDHQTGDIKIFDPTSISNLPAYLDRYDVLIGHNSIAYDLPILRKIFGWDYSGKSVDTLLMSRLQRPNRPSPRGYNGRQPHSVEAWGYRLGHRKVENEVWDVYTPNMLSRCKEDVKIQKVIFDALLEEGHGEHWGPAHRLNSRLFYWLQRQAEYGWYIDVPHMDNCLTTLDRWISRIDRTVIPYLPVVCEILEVKKDGQYTCVERPFKKDGAYTTRVIHYWDNECDYVCGPFSRINLRKVDLDKNLEVKKFLLSQGWEPDEWNTNNAGEQTSPKLSKDDHFRGITSGLGKLIAKRVQCKQRRGVIEGWKSLIRMDNRIAAEVSGMAATGRIRHRGIVNVPSPHSNAFFAKQMRAIFSSVPEYVLVGCDSKGNQIRQLAARMNDDEFTKAVLHGRQEDGTDLHSLNQKRSGAPSRSQAKNFFYGFIFGAGPKKISSTINIPLNRAKALIETYLQELPALKVLIDRLTSEWRQTAQKWYNKKWGRMEYRNGYIRGLDGRPILVDSEHKILAYTLQSDEAIQMAAAYVWFNEQMLEYGYKWGEDWSCVIWMHDEFQFEVRPSIVEHASELARQSITWAGEHYNIACPHEGETKVGRNWSETH